MEIKKVVLLLTNALVLFSIITIYQFTIKDEAIGFQPSGPGNDQINLEVKDNQDNWSNWDDDHEFTTPNHPYSWPSFEHDWEKMETPDENSDNPPIITYKTTFTNKSKCWECPGDGSDCSIITDGCLGYEWDFEIDGTIDYDDFEPTHIYQKKGIYNVSLKAIDFDSDPIYSQTKPQQVSVGDLPFPEWKETPPF